MPKKYKIHLTRNAQTDIERIFFYIASDNLNTAKRFIREIEEKIYSLDVLPDRCPYIPENMFFGTSYRHLIYKKYRVIYRINYNSIYILRVVHGAQLLEL
ncbi:type II toxin-antitoxin system RelE/ParE family toxin [uncultured Desulfosarcina sp.]|uniref:type II toxin-antitoxin system RelE/ParE family toxin n=1 Tax=uncultured Desulfosarcina sp. TaxID=218289 RepID=UPI0029C812FF|nr:type II toxin-antitoxin system RelE/ParE family toxin [uncultured Desulfosarcina sp.]